MFSEDVWPSKPAAEAPRVEKFSSDTRDRSGDHEPTNWHRDIRSDFGVVPPKLGSAWGKRVKTIPDHGNVDSAANRVATRGNAYKKGEVGRASGPLHETNARSANEVLKRNWDVLENGRLRGEMEQDETSLGDPSYGRSMRGSSEDESPTETLVSDEYESGGIPFNDVDFDQLGIGGDDGEDDDVVAGVAPRSFDLESPAPLLRPSSVDEADSEVEQTVYSQKRNEWSSPNPGERINVWGRKRYFVPSFSPRRRWKFAGKAKA